LAILMMNSDTLLPSPSKQPIVGAVIVSYSSIYHSKQPNSTKIKMV